MLFVKENYNLRHCWTHFVRNYKLNKTREPEIVKTRLNVEKKGNDNVHSGGCVNQILCQIMIISISITSPYLTTLTPNFRKSEERNRSKRERRGEKRRSVKEKGVIKKGEKVRASKEIVMRRRQKRLTDQTKKTIEVT